MQARFAASEGPKETFEEYKLRKEKEDASEREKELQLEADEGARFIVYHCIIPKD